MSIRRALAGLIRYQTPLTIAIAACVTFSLVAAVRVDANHDGFHRYATGHETTGTGFTGVSTYRRDQAVTGQAADGCSQPFTGHPVYQTMWVRLDSQLNWRELGTGHQCGDSFRYWYWGYGSNGAWFPIAFQPGVTNGQNHTFKISKANITPPKYYFVIDTTTKGSLSSAATFERVAVGLETYASGATVVGYFNSTLKYQKNGGTFVDWVGQDALTLSAGMCGGFVIDTNFESGQGATC
jgi:hypothetical protein